MWQYLESLFPEVFKCFFPTFKSNKSRSALQWPGLTRAVKCLVLEAICFILASLLLMVMTLTYGFLLVTGQFVDNALPDLPPASGPKKGEAFPVTKLDASNHKLAPGYPAIIQAFMSRSEPVIIKNLPKETFSALARGSQYAPAPKEDLVQKRTVLINFFLRPRALGGIGDWIKKNVNQSVLYMLRFSGSYSSIPAHLDGFTYNIYHLAKGRKRVWICPRQYNHLLNLRSDRNAVVIPGSDRTSSNHLKWIESVPGVWAFELEAGDLLIFNNTACVHKFVNVTEVPEVFSMRVLTGNLSPVLAKHHIFNWQQARQSITLLFSMSKTVEKPATIANADGVHPEEEENVKGY